MLFSLETFYNPHLTDGATRLDTVITVTSTASASGAPSKSLKKVFGYMIDTSGSMDGQKMSSAKLALRQQINMLSESDWFFIISYHSTASVLVQLTQATVQAKSIAHDRVQKLSAGGGTVMSLALQAAKKQFAMAGEALAYAQFVTDGQNDNRDHAELMNTVEACKGHFQCDAWGIGTDWDAKQLREIALPLLGTADAVPDPEKLDHIFRAALARAMSRGIADVRLRLQTPKTCKVISVKQQLPEIVDLTAMSRSFDDKNIDVPLGAWGAESRDYYVVLELAAQAEGEEMMAFRPKIVYTENGQEVIADGARVIVTWTGDDSLSTRINDQVAHYSGQQELSRSISEGLEAKNRGDLDQATVLLGRAYKLARDSGNDDVTQRIKKVVEVVDEDAGTVRIKAGNNKAADMELDMGGTRTVRRRPAASST